MTNAGRPTFVNQLATHVLKNTQKILEKLHYLINIALVDREYFQDA